MPAESRVLALRAGVSLVEALAALTLSSLVVSLVVGVCVAQMRLARVTASRAIATETARTVTTVLAGEARRSIAMDVRAFSTDSLAIRSFRGAALPCGSAAGAVHVRFTGDRLPDPAKDSVLVVATPHEHTLGLIDSRAVADAACQPAPRETVLAWRLEGTVPVPSVLLLFESGTYHLSSGALRYRLGNAGRQPLTAEALRHPFTQFVGVSEHGIRFRLDVDGHSVTHAAPFAR